MQERAREKPAQRLSLFIGTWNKPQLSQRRCLKLNEETIILRMFPLP